jgi:formyl-CoA transferase
MNGCLEGIRVLELGNFISGPYGAMLLADMGAEVIKIENPKGGDPFRGWDLGGDQPNFWAYNRGKKAITLNLQTPEGKEIFLALAKNADVVLDNYRPGVMKKLGIDYDTVSKTNPAVIYLSITGTGPTGPYVKRPAYDTVGQGLGGMLSLLMDAKNPRPIGPNYADSLSGMFACIGVLGAIAARRPAKASRWIRRWPARLWRSSSRRRRIPSPLARFPGPTRGRCNHRPTRSRVPTEQCSRFIFRRRKNSGKVCARPPVIQS